MWAAKRGHEILKYDQPPPQKKKTQNAQFILFKPQKKHTQFS